MDRERSETSWKLSNVAAEVRERPHAEDGAAGLGQGIVDIRGGGVNVHEQAGGRARHFLDVERRLGLGLVARAEGLPLVPGRHDGDVLVAQEAGLLDDEAGVLVDLVGLVNPEGNGDALPVRRRAACRDTVPTCTPDMSTWARGFRPPTVGGVKQDVIGGPEERGALAELDQQHRPAAPGR